MTRAPSSVSYLDTLEKYGLTQQGVRNGFNAVNYTAQIVQIVVPLKTHQISVAQKVAKGFSFVADGTFVIDFFVSLKLTTQFSYDFTSTLVKRKWETISLKARNFIYVGLGLVADAVESVKFLNGVLGVASATRLTLFGSGAGVIRGIMDIKTYLFLKSPDAFKVKNLARRALLIEKAYLIKLRIVQTIVFLAADSLTLVAALYATVNVGGLILATLSIGVVLNVRTYFAQQSIEAKERLLSAKKKTHA